jgi:hypothetical protein
MIRGSCQEKNNMYEAMIEPSLWQVVCMFGIVAGHKSTTYV